MSESNDKLVSSHEAAAFMLAAVVTSAPIFIVAFNLGAYGEVFYEHLFALWATSISVLIAGIVVGRTTHCEVYNPWYGNVLLLLPTAWIISGVALSGNQASWANWVNSILAWSTAVLALPYILLFIIMAMAPDIDRLRTPRLRWSLTAIWVMVFVVGMTVGFFNDWVLTCKDFKIAGSDLPGNRWRPDDR